MAIRSIGAAFALGLFVASCGAPEPAGNSDADVAAPAPAAEEPRMETNAAMPDPAEAGGEPSSGAGTAATAETVSACLEQGAERIPANRLKAIGTEPFWGARIEGRCVTYSTPEDQDGTRVWTQFSGSAERGSWSGYLDEQRFVLRTRPQPGCSDGMSDNLYPIAVTLTVRGEERTGCAVPL